jgi:hypothetical protein
MYGGKPSHDSYSIYKMQDSLKTNSMHIKNSTLKLLLNVLLDIGKLKLMVLDIAITVSRLTLPQFIHTTISRRCMNSDKNGWKNGSSFNQ